MPRSVQVPLGVVAERDVGSAGAGGDDDGRAGAERGGVVGAVAAAAGGGVLVGGRPRLRGAAAGAGAGARLAAAGADARAGGPRRPRSGRRRPRVLAVNRTGLVAIYSPQARPRLEGADIIMRSLGRAGLFADPQLKAGRRINTPVSRLSTTNPLKLLAGSENTQSSPSLWNLREISLIHQRVLVIAEIAWDARKGAPSTTPTPGSGPGPVVYLVTWEIDGGGLKGNLFTNSTCVTLSLWPDTVCHIKVEVYDSKQRSRPDQSEELVLDTHRVSRAESEEAPSAAPSSAPLSQAAPPTGAPGGTVRSRSGRWSRSWASGAWSGWAPSETRSSSSSSEQPWLLFSSWASSPPSPSATVAVPTWLPRAPLSMPPPPPRSLASSTRSASSRAGISLNAHRPVT
ncbi:unnamed protein product [Bemisia tabaci]|uniref:Uncharacterized protein n=1 Tax=Bemisia tabaci TaxID=7038 RepID=A0A9P0AA05_BEMTA|nr:unnamed protein product [Bemisia tabaci]